MAGFAGAFLSVGQAARFVPDVTNERGWLAIIIVIAGLWRPYPILVAALVFSFLDALQLQIQGIGIAIPYQYVLMMPYVAAILALMIRRSRASAPAMLGVLTHGNRTVLSPPIASSLSAARVSRTAAVALLHRGPEAAAPFSLLDQQAVDIEPLPSLPGADKAKLAGLIFAANNVCWRK
ncbi:hypothetical protein [Mesorhizobium sp. M1405]|uniref:hypothetical protein n=1 Tax=Mesorhizobium sp. M1405 TaxID=2957098 RepID=UPI003335BADA